jgi:hypothetical protein
MVDGLNTLVWNRTKKPPAIALNGVGKGFKGRDAGGNVNNVQYKSNWKMLFPTIYPKKSTFFCPWLIKTYLTFSNLFSIIFLCTSISMTHYDPCASFDKFYHTSQLFKKTLNNISSNRNSLKVLNLHIFFFTVVLGGDTCVELHSFSSQPSFISNFTQ